MDIQGCKGGEQTSDYIVIVIDLSKIEDKSIPESLVKDLGDFGTHI